jgi:hexokinase
VRDKHGRFAVVEQFLDTHNMHPNFTNMAEVLTKFRHHMNMGLADSSKSSLLMIPTYVPLPKQLTANRKVLAIDAGGTNLRKGVVSFSASAQVNIEAYEQSSMPGSSGVELSKAEFYHQLASVVSGDADKYTHLGLCFSYPTQSTPNCDGKILFFSKEIQAPQVVGSYVGASLLEAIAQQNSASTLKHAIVVNDTVTTLLSGMLHSNGKHYSSYMGFILGTGMNMAYVCPNFKIVKLHDLPLGASQVINMEAGGFSELIVGDIDTMLDATTQNPGQFIMEKMMSGAYLNKLCMHTFAVAIAEGLLDSSVAAKLSPILSTLSTKDVCDFHNNLQDNNLALNKVFEGESEAMAQIARQLIAALLERSAKIIAATLSATILESGEGSLATHPICITIDGTTFYAFDGFADEIKRLMKEEILINANTRYFEFHKVENASMIGAAIASYAF